MKKFFAALAVLAVSLVALVAVPSMASAAPAVDATNQVHDVIIKLNGEAIVVGGITVTQNAKVAAGSSLKISNVPNDAEVHLQYGPDYSLELPLTKSTQQARTWVYNSLPPASRFWVRVLAADDTKSLVRFSTGAAPSFFTGEIHPVPVAARCPHHVCKYGVGIPIRIEFDTAITNKKAVEQNLEVISSKPLGAASWAWIDSKTVAFRPRDYWPAYDKVTIKANLATVEGAPGQWGQNFSMKFETGTKTVLKDSIDKYRMVFYQDDKKVKVFPISSGREGHETETGIKVISEKYGYMQKTLWNPDPKDGWKIKVAYAMRITWDGEFIHSAPWNYSLGEANLSHGCTNMSDADSKWVYEHVRIGDVVENVGGTVATTNDNVYGYWNYSWKQWRAMSALTTTG